MSDKQGGSWNLRQQMGKDPGDFQRTALKAVGPGQEGRLAHQVAELLPQPGKEGPCSWSGVYRTEVLS